MSRLNNLPEKILIVAPSWIGDAVLSQPLLARLAARRQAPVIDVLAPKWVLPVYRRMYEVAETIENPFGHGQLALGQRRRLGRVLAGRGYSHAYVLPNSLKSALVPWFAGIRTRIGYTGEMRYALLTERRVFDEQKLPLMVERFHFHAFIGFSNVVCPFIDRSFGHHFSAERQWRYKPEIDRIGNHLILSFDQHHDG